MAVAGFAGGKKGRCARHRKVKNSQARRKFGEIGEDHDPTKRRVAGRVAGAHVDEAK